MVFKEVERIMKANGWAPVYRIGFQYHYRKAGCESPAPIPDLGGRALPIDILVIFTFHIHTAITNKESAAHELPRPAPLETVSAHL